MLYTILINQAGIIKNELDKKTDLIDWAIINYLQSWYFSEKKKTMYSMEKGKNYVWVNYNHLIENMPILSIKDKTALTYRFQKLKKLGLIDTFQTKDNTLYFDLTEYCMQVIAFSEYKENNKNVNKNIEEEKKEPDEIDSTPCSNSSDRGDEIDSTAQLVYQSNNNNSFEEEKSLEHSKELLISDTDSLIDIINKYKKPNIIYQVYLLYIKNWTKRYKSLKEPILTKKLAGQIKLVLRDFSNIDELEKMLRAFIACDEGYLIAKAHDFGLFLLDLNKWLALSEHPELAYQFTTEYAKQRKYLDKKQIVEKEEKQIREREIRQQIELEEQEKERLRKEREEKEKQRLEEEKKKAEAERLVQEQKAKELLKDFEDSGIMNKLKKKGQ